MKRIFVTLLVLASCLSFVQVYDLQSEIDNASNGGTVIIPCGVYDIGDVIIASNDVWQKVVTIQGCGHGHLGQSPGQGSTQWDYLIERGYTYGTVLRGTISVQKGSYPGATTAKAYFRDFSLIGYGSGIGIDYGDGVNMFPEGGIENVSIGNYDIGIRLRRSYYVEFEDIHMAGTGIGLQIIDSNVINVRNFNVVNCGMGLDAQGNGNTFEGGSVQACNQGVQLGGFSNVFGGYYFEQIRDVALLVSGRGHTILTNYFAGNAGDPYIEISGHNNRLLPTELNKPIVITGNYNRVELAAYSECSDSGYANQCTRLFP